MNVKVSIILPVYNCIKYLEQSIESIITQDYPNIELIIIDGGSTDGTVEVIKKYVDHIFYWISEPDKGTSDAINKGIAKANGEMISFFAADDYFTENTAVSKIISCLNNNKATDVIVIDQRIVSRENQEFIGYLKNDFRSIDILNNTKPNSSVIKSYKLHFEIRGAFIRNNKFKRKELLSQEYKLVNDTELTYYLWSRGAVFYYLPEPLVTARDGGMSYRFFYRYTSLIANFRLHKSYFGLLAALRIVGYHDFIKYSLFMPIARICYKRGIRPFTWFRRIRSFFKTK
jgi:glycosyltransferase involved in cell wall biosynthesis